MYVTRSRCLNQGNRAWNFRLGTRQRAERWTISRRRSSDTSSISIRWTTGAWAFSATSCSPAALHSKAPTMRPSRGSPTSTTNFRTTSPSPPGGSSITYVQHGRANCQLSRLVVVALAEGSEEAHVTCRLHRSSMAAEERLQVHVRTLQMSDLREHG